MSHGVTESIYDLFNATNNLDDPIPPLNHKATAYGVVISTLVLAYICAGSRLFVRFFITRCPGLDDLFVVLSMVVGSALAIAVLIGFNEGLGGHFLNIVSSAEQVERFTKVAYVENACYPTATALIKIAILLQFRRVFTESAHRYQIVTKIMIVVTALWGLSFSFISWFPAFPVYSFWDLRVTNATRYGIASLNLTSLTSTYATLTASNMTLDLLILMIPIPYFLRSALSWRSRASLMGLFLLGLVINFISLYRMIYVIQTKAGTYPTLDPTFYGCTPIVLSSLEVLLAAIAASLPVFWPIIQHNLGNIFVTYEVTIVTEERKGRDGCREAESRRSDAPPHLWIPQDIPMAYLSTEITKGGTEEDKESLVKPGFGLSRSTSTSKMKSYGQTGH